MSIRRLRLLFAAYGIALGFTLPWNVPQLSESGMDPGQVGTVLGVAALMSLIAYPVWGLDRGHAAGPRSDADAGGHPCGAGGCGIVVSADEPTWLAVFIVAQLVCIAPWAPVSDALALTELGNHAARVRPDAQRHVRGLDRGRR